MSIIIVAQSLKNDDTSDIQIDGKFSPSLEKLRKLEEFDKNGRTIKFGEKNGIKYGYINNTLGFLINCEEKDNLDRYSPIAIQANISETNDVIIEHFNSFLENSKRTVSNDKKILLKEIIETARKNQNEGSKKSILKGAVVFVALAGLSIYSCFKGKEKKASSDETTSVNKNKKKEEEESLTLKEKEN